MSSSAGIIAYITDLSQTTSANTDSFRIPSTGDSGGWAKLAFTVGAGAVIYKTFQLATQQWFDTTTKVSHEPHKFRYVHQKKHGISPTENLAPLDEENNLRQTLRHLRRLLRNPSYRMWQLKQLNAINKQMDLPLVKFDEKAVREQLKRYYISPKKLREMEEKQRREKEQKLKAKKKAEQLLKLLSTLEQREQLEKEQRIEIIAKNGKIFEVLADGKVNRLYPDGSKEGLCVVPKKFGNIPVADEILMKKALLEADPDKFEEVANKTTPFQLSL